MTLYWKGPCFGGLKPKNRGRSQVPGIYLIQNFPKSVVPTLRPGSSEWPSVASRIIGSTGSRGFIHVWKQGGRALGLNQGWWFTRDSQYIMGPPYLGGGFKYFLSFIPTWGNDPIWRAYGIWGPIIWVPWKSPLIQGNVSWKVETSWEVGTPGITKSKVKQKLVHLPHP